MGDLFEDCDLGSATAPTPPPRRQPLSPKQAAIMQALRSGGQITLDQAVRLIGGDLYCNAPKHVGALLGNMVRRGLLVRVRPGVFEGQNK